MAAKKKKTKKKSAKKNNSGADFIVKSKVKEFIAQFPDVDVALAKLTEMTDRLDGDQETQSLLRTIAQDERSTLQFLHEACALLNPS